jgi:hypothetical protein
MTEANTSFREKLCYTCREAFVRYLRECACEKIDHASRRLVQVGTWRIGICEVYVESDETPLKLG